MDGVLGHVRELRGSTELDDDLSFTGVAIE
jgi:hypothetical protein